MSKSKKVKAVKGAPVVQNQAKGQVALERFQAVLNKANKPKDTK